MLLFTCFLLLLIASLTLQQQFDVRFQLTQSGFKFDNDDLADPHSTLFNISSMIKCTSLCSMDISCFTVDYDSQTRACRLFTVWIKFSRIIVSSSLTMRVGYIVQTSRLYLQYNQSCNPSNQFNRFLDCSIDSRWSCHTGNVYNGSMCVKGNQTQGPGSEQTNCLLMNGMEWNGTSCVGLKITSNRWNSSGTTVAGVAGVNGPASNLLRTPAGIVVDSNFNIYISDKLNNRIQKWAPSATEGITVAGRNEGGSGNDLISLNGPTGITLDADGNMYIADSGAHRVQFWSQGATSGITIAGTGAGGNALNQLDMPSDVSLDPRTNEFYVCDLLNHRIMRFSMSLPIGTVVAGGNGQGTENNQLNYPQRAFFDIHSESIFITNTASHNIIRWFLGRNTWILVAGSASFSAGNTATLLNYPVGLVVDHMRNIYVADTENQRIQLFLANSSIAITIAGLTGNTGSTSESLNFPQTLCIDSQMNLYVTDTFNDRIQKFIFQ